MTPDELQLARDLGVSMIMSVALLILARAGKPMIEALLNAMKEGAQARRDQVEVNRTVLKRWEESDDTMEKNTAALEEVVRTLKTLHDTDLERIEQNKLTAAEIRGTRAEVGALANDVRGATSALAANTDATKGTGAQVNDLKTRFDKFEADMHQSFQEFKQALEDGLSDKRMSGLMEAMLEVTLTRMKLLVAPEPASGGTASPAAQPGAEGDAS